MTKSLNIFSVLTRKHLIGALIAITATLGFSTSANAQAAGTGLIQGAVCESAYGFPLPGGSSSTGLATTNVIHLAGAASTEGFNNTSTAIRLNQSGGGTAAATINLTYNSESSANDFFGFRFKYKTVGSGVPAATTVRFCFQTANGTGSYTTYTTTLKALPKGGATNGFTLAYAFAPQFGSFDPSTSVLRKVTIALTDPNVSNGLTIGYNQVDTFGDGVNHGFIVPANVNLNKAGCTAITSCP